jgi:hypothetical protein
MCSQIQEDELQRQEDSFLEDFLDNGWLDEATDILKSPVIFETDVSNQSTAVERFGYNPNTEEFMIQWQTSEKRYIYPEVTADEAADFLRDAWGEQPEPSYGKAANTFKGLHESTRVRKIRYDEAIAIIGTMNLGEVHAMITALRTLSYIN